MSPGKRSICYSNQQQRGTNDRCGKSEKTAAKTHPKKDKKIVR